VPNKTIYVSDDDLPLYQRAQVLAGGNLSSAITTALRRFVEAEEGREEGYDEITVRVGLGRGRKQRFSGVLLGEWGRSTKQGQVEEFRVYRTRKGKYAVHLKRSKGWTTDKPAGEKSDTGWRSWMGDWSSDAGWGVIPAESTLTVADSLEELKEILPPGLYDIVAAVADQTPIEDLDI